MVNSLLFIGNKLTFTSVKCTEWLIDLSLLQNVKISNGKFTWNSIRRIKYESLGAFL